MRVLALDQSTNVTGWSLFDGERLIDYGVIDFSKYTNVDERVSKLKKWTNQLIKKTKPEIFILEDIQFQRNQYTYKVLAELLGVLKNNYYDKKYLYVIVAPTQWKSYLKIKGRRRKEQKQNTQLYIKKKFNIDVSEDEADAIGIGWYAANKIVPNINSQ